MPASTVTVSGRLSNIVNFAGEVGEVLYATFHDCSGERPRTRRLTISGPVLDEAADQFVDDAVIRIVCEERPLHATDRVLSLA